MLPQVVARCRMTECKCIVNNREEVGNTGIGTVTRNYQQRQLELL